jgi:hypothetical protein
MTAIAMLVPDFALQLPPRSCYNSFAFVLHGLGLLNHPRVRESMFKCSNGSKSNVLRQVFRDTKNIRF